MPQDTNESLNLYNSASKKAKQADKYKSIEVKKELYIEAINDYTLAISEGHFEKNAEIFYFRGLSKYNLAEILVVSTEKMELYIQAIGDFTKAIDENYHRNGESFYFRALSKYSLANILISSTEKMESYSAAIDDYTKAINKNLGSEGKSSIRKLDF